MSSRTARPQEPDAPAPATSARRSRLRGRWELTIGGGRWGSSTLGTTDASLIANETPRGGDFRLFTATTRIASAAAVEMTLGYRLTRLVNLEAGLGLAQPEVRTTISGDVEVPDTVVATDRMTQLIADGALLVRVPRLRLVGVVPFVRGGAGYVRQVHEDRRAVETGYVFVAGVGATYALLTRPGAAIQGIGLRGEVRSLWYRDTFELDDARGASLNGILGLTFHF